MAKRKPFTFDSNLDKVLAKVEEKPHRVMNEVGLALAKEIRPKVNARPSSKKRGTPFMRWTTQFWARKREKDLIIGYKNHAGMKYLYDEVDDPIKPTVVANIPNIQKAIGKALDEIRKDKS